MIKLSALGSKMVSFVIEPRYKYINLGTPINYADVVVFRNVKSNQYLHISLRDPLMPKLRIKTEFKTKALRLKF